MNMQSEIWSTSPDWGSMYIEYKPKWGAALKENLQKIAPDGNTRKTRILVVSGTIGLANGESVLTNKNLKDDLAFNDDEQYVNTLKECEQTNNMTFHVVNLANYYNKRALLLSEVDYFAPQVIILAFPHSSSHGFIDPELGCLKWNPPLSCGDVTRTMYYPDLICGTRFPGFIRDIMITNDNYIFFKTTNMLPVPEWGTTMLRYLRKVAPYGNTSQTRILVLSGSRGDENGESALSNSCLEDTAAYEEDKYFVESLKDYEKTDAMVLDPVMNLMEYHKNPEQLVKDVVEFAPTVIVLTFRHSSSHGYIEPIDGHLRWDTPCGDVTRLLVQDVCLLDDILIEKDNFIFFETLNMFEKGSIGQTTLVTSQTKATEDGLDGSLLKYLKTIAPRSSKEKTRILILSGCHGLKCGESGFTDSNNLAYRFYADMCRLVGISVGGDPCEDSTIEKPVPTPKKKDPNASANAFLNRKDMEHIEFDVLNIAHYVGHSRRLVEYVQIFRPSTVVIDWCHAQNGDVANALRKSGIFSRKVLEDDFINQITEHGYQKFLTKIKKPNN